MLAHALADSIAPPEATICSVLLIPARYCEGQDPRSAICEQYRTVFRISDGGYSLEEPRGRRQLLCNCRVAGSIWDWQVISQKSHPDAKTRTAHNSADRLHHSSREHCTSLGHLLAGDRSSSGESYAMIGYNGSKLGVEPCLSRKHFILMK